MALSSTDHRHFFGIDLGQWPAQWQAAGALLLNLPGLRWLAPAVRVRLLRADGRQSDWDVTQGIATPILPGQSGAAAAHALELAPDRVLERRLLLPPLAPADLERAVQLEVASASPFPPGQTISGHAATPMPGGACRVDIAITSRQQVEQVLSQTAAGPMPEVWAALPAAGALGSGGALRPVVLQGFGERVRQRAARRILWQRLALLALALALLGVLIVTPSALLRLRARQGYAAFTAIERQAAPQIAQRETLMRRAERLQAVGQIMENQLALPPVLDMLTRAVPDGAWLTMIRVEGSKLTLNGSADDAAALVQRLTAQPGVRSARLTAPATRPQGANKETFAIELTLDTARYGLTIPHNAGAAAP